jgi:RNA polymerase sigma factor (TIGR02999 family)
MPDLADEIKALLESNERDGGPGFDALVSQLYTDLRRVARGQLRRGPQPSSLGTTSLVHETYLKLTEHGSAQVRGSAHFRALAARTMRHIVIDHARRRSRQKRGGGQVDLPLQDQQIAGAADTARFLELDEALGRLERVDSRLVQVIEFLFFAGLSEKETAEALGVAERTIQRDLRRAKDWLRETLGT